MIRFDGGKAVSGLENPTAECGDLMKFRGDVRTCCETTHGDGYFGYATAFHAAVSSVSLLDAIPTNDDDELSPFLGPTSL